MIWCGTDGRERQRVGRATLFCGIVVAKHTALSSSMEHASFYEQRDCKAAVMLTLSHTLTDVLLFFLPTLTIISSQIFNFFQIFCPSYYRSG